jgi:hypothetical protein
MSCTHGLIKTIIYDKISLLLNKIKSITHTSDNLYDLP